jgi:hypothetical protein
MNYFQSFNAAMMAGIFAAVGTALFRGQSDLSAHPLKVWFFVAFLILFRLKISWDDHKYFATARTKTTGFKIGLLIGIVSYVLWLGAALSLSNLLESFYIAGWAIGVSTFWIVTVAVMNGAYREQFYWLVVNTALILLLWGAARREPIPDDVTQLVLLGIAVLVVLGDIAVSHSVPELDQ